MLYDLIVIGGGPAGLAAAIEAKKKGINSILLIERDRELGGILQQCVHSGFGLHIFGEELTGPEYAQRFIDEFNSLGIEYKLNTMVLNIEDENIVNCVSREEGYLELKSKAIILAMGCRERTAGAISMPGLRPSGIFTAGTAQRYINIEGYMVGKKILILGSGDIGLIMARRLTLEGAEVVCVAEIMPHPNGLARNIAQCLDDFGIPLLVNHTVTNVFGKDRVEGIELSEVDDERKLILGTQKRYECDTLLLSVGLIPENEVSKSIDVNLDSRTRGPVVNELMHTSVEGIFACGNVVHVHDLVDYVTEESYRAADGVSKYLKSEILSGDYVDVKSGNGISYVVPQRINIKDVNKDLNLLMRVKEIYENSYIELKINDNLIKKVYRSKLLPSEMINIDLNYKELDFINGNCLEVSVLEKEDD